MTDGEPPSFRTLAPHGWAFHRQSSRWAFNMLNPDADETPEAGKEYSEAPFAPLPHPAELPISLQAAVDARESRRSFTSDAMALSALASVLRNSIGACGARLLGNLELTQRPCPSPGGLYPIEAYVIARRVAGVAPGIYHYHPQTHGLARIRDGLPPVALETYLFMGQPYAVTAAATVVLTAEFARSLKKYRDRGYRYALIEAGHIGQNIALACAALGLGCCPLGGFLDVELGQLLMLDPEQEFPLYALAIGPA